MIDDSRSVTRVRDPCSLFVSPVQGRQNLESKTTPLSLLFLEQNLPQFTRLCCFVPLHYLTPHPDKIHPSSSFRRDSSTVHSTLDLLLFLGPKSSMSPSRNVFLLCRSRFINFVKFYYQSCCFSIFILTPLYFLLSSFNTTSIRLTSNCFNNFNSTFKPTIEGLQFHFPFTLVRVPDERNNFFQYSQRDPFFTRKDRES